MEKREHTGREARRGQRRERGTKKKKRKSRERETKLEGKERRDLRAHIHKVQEQAVKK